MTENLLFQLSAVLVVGIAAQWLAWRVHIPSILLLLFSGFLAGPILGLVNPDLMFGDLLLPIVSLSVAIIMFEGGLGLKFRDIEQTGWVVTLLVSVGALLTWVLASLSAHYILALDWSLSLLLGGILIVTGPTVILPLLRHIRPVGRVGSVLKWEGILIDPVGALAVVLIFGAIWEAEGAGMSWLVMAGVAKTAVFGMIFGLAGAGVIYVVFKNHWAPDHLHNPIVLMAVAAVFTLCNHIQHESGLFAVTVMGIALANQKTIDMQYVLEFKEDLVVLLLSSLFVLLAARIDPGDLYALSLQSIPFLIVLILAIRPISVFICTLASDLNWKERAFIAWMAPRGIVAAAVASIFALKLEDKGYPGAETLVPYTFLAIIGTVAVYGLTAGPVGRMLQLAQSNPQGVLIVGANTVARRIGAALAKHGFAVQLVDTNRRNVHDARLEGLNAHYGNVLSDYILLPGIGRLMALTPNDECNSLAALHYTDEFSRSGVYQLKPEERSAAKTGYTPKSLRGRYLFHDNATYGYLNSRIGSGAVVKSTSLTDEFQWEDWLKMYGDEATPLFLVDEKNELLEPFATDGKLEPAAGKSIVFLAQEGDS